MTKYPKKTVTIVGSTGSVGVNTLRVIEENSDFFEVSGLAVSSNAELLKLQIEKFKPRAVYLKDSESAVHIGRVSNGLKIFTGEELEAFADFANADILVAASSGTSSLSVVLAALKAGKRVALANKEILVIAGSLVMETLKNNLAASLLPVDSEHSAIFQCLQGSKIEAVTKLILTGSGGPLKDLPSEKFFGISKEIVVNHPKWKMGKKISVDSATLMNKGLEMIEASWLFGTAIDRIEVLIHPEALIHSMVEYCDGTVMAQLGITDMRLPIRYALSDRKSTRLNSSH